MITATELEPLVAAWHEGQDATDSRRVADMLREETARIHREFDRLPIQVQFVDFDPYQSFEQMRDEVASSRQMLVWTGASETPLWDERTNWMARAVHDWDHLEQSCDFSIEGEGAAFRHAAQCNPGLAPLYMSEIMLQAAVQSYEGAFAEAQKLVILPEELERRASALRGLGDGDTASAELVWDTARLLRFGSDESAMAHLAAQGVDPETALIVLDAARMLNDEVDGQAPTLGGTMHRDDRWDGFYSGQFWSPNRWGDEDFYEGIGHGDNSIPVRNLDDGRPKPDEDHVWFSPDAMSGESLAVESNHEVMQRELDALEDEHGRDYYQALHGGGRMMVFHIERTPPEIMELLDALESYHLLDEGNYSALKEEAEQEAWEQWGDREYRRALESRFGGDADFVEDGQLFLHFMIDAEAANEYWEESSDGGVYIDVQSVVDKLDTVPVGYKQEHEVNG